MSSKAHLFFLGGGICQLSKCIKDYILRIPDGFVIIMLNRLLIMTSKAP